METLKRLSEDETLLVQSGKPVGVFRTHADAPRVLIANSNLVPKWATWDHFHELDRKGLMMYGQMLRIVDLYRTQGIVQGTYELAEIGRQHYDGDLRGPAGSDRGLGGIGGAQPLAAGGGPIASRSNALIADRAAAEPAISTAARLHRRASSATRIAGRYLVGLLVNAPRILPEMVTRVSGPTGTTRPPRTIRSRLLPIG